MTRIRMHADEVFTDVALVRRLLAAQFPHWADLPIEPVSSYGTDHDIYRLGMELCVRLPRIGWATAQAAREAQWLPRLAPHLPLRLPVPVAMGQPAEAYPFAWSVYEWLPVTTRMAASTILGSAIERVRRDRASAGEPRRAP